MTQLSEAPTPNPKADPNQSTTRGGLFPMTQWSMISNARGEDDEQVRDGLRELATAYWRPLYLYLRKRGESHADASDSVQGFFEYVFGSGFFKNIAREGGKFRSYLLKSLERWRSSRRTYLGAQKRGGQVEHVPLDGLSEFREYADGADVSSPEQAFDQQWASDMVGRAVSMLSEDYERRGRGDWFAELSAALPGAGELRPYSELAVELGASEGALRKAVHDLRTAFAVRLRAEIRATVRSNEDAEEELSYLISVLREG